MVIARLAVSRNCSPSTSPTSYIPANIQPGRQHAKTRRQSRTVLEVHGWPGRLLSLREYCLMVTVRQIRIEWLRAIIVTDELVPPRSCTRIILPSNICLPTNIHSTIDKGDPRRRWLLMAKASLLQPLDRVATANAASPTMTRSARGRHNRKLNWSEARALDFEFRPTLVLDRHQFLMRPGVCSVAAMHVMPYTVACHDF